MFRTDTFTFVLYTNSSVSDNKITNFCIPSVTHAWHGMLAVLLLFFCAFFLFGVCVPPNVLCLHSHRFYRAKNVTPRDGGKQREREKDSSHQHANIDFKFFFSLKLGETHSNAYRKYSHIHRHSNDYAWLMAINRHWLALIEIEMCHFRPI